MGYPSQYTPHNHYIGFAHLGRRHPKPATDLFRLSSKHHGFWRGMSADVQASGAVIMCSMMPLISPRYGGQISIQEIYKDDYGG